jgi:hypothetical protein
MRFYSYDRRDPEPYSYDRRKVADAEDVGPLIAGFRRALETGDKKWVELDEALTKGDTMAAVRAMVYVPGFFEVLKNYGKAHLIFWGILQQYKISSTSDRKLIEQASKEFSKDRLQRPKREAAMEALRKKLDLYRTYLEAAERVVKKGELHADESSGTTEAAGCFTLVNAGGFTPDQMADVAKIVEKASSLVKAKGFGKICYGTIQVTNNVSNNAKVLAFYALQTDEMFVRGNLKGKQNPAVGTFIHELAHRLHVKFLMSKNDQIKAVYDSLKNGEVASVRDLLGDKSKWPQPGETYEEKGLVYEVEGVRLNQALNYVVSLRLKEKPTLRASLPLQAWMANKGHRPKEVFVTPYARTSYSENFAEMFENYILDTLPDGQVQMLEAIIK